MKRILLIAALGTATLSAACGNQSHNVTRGHTDPLGLFDFAPDHSGGTSTRSSIDLLSMG